MEIIALTNQKGGVGKTTTAVNLATALAACRKKTLLIDLDPQMNASTALSADKKIPNSYDVITHKNNINEAIQQSKVPFLHHIAASRSLAGLDIEFAQTANKENYLRSQTKNLPQDYDYVFLDCPPSLNLLTVNALSAAHSVMVPMQCEFYSLEGLSYLLENIAAIKKNFNNALRLEAIVITMYDSRPRLTAEVIADIEKFLPKALYNTKIPRNIRIAEAPSHGKPVILYDLQSRGAQAYVQLAGEFLKRRIKRK